MSTSQPASLVTLPQEIIDEIISGLAQNEISRLSMTCQKMRKATKEALFRNVTMVWRGDESSSQKTSIPRIDCLLRTFVENPQLATYVSIINVQEVGYRKTSRRGGTPQLPGIVVSKDYAESVQQILDDIDCIEPQSKKRLKEGVLSNSFDAVIALVLLLCPNITTLELGLDILVDNEYLPHIFEYFGLNTTSRKSAHLESMQDLRLGTSMYPEEDSFTFLVRYPQTISGKMPQLNTYLPLFYLSNLKHLEVSLPGLPKGQEFVWPASTPPQLMALTSLRLHACSISPEILRQMLAATPSLTNLYYDCWLEASAFDASMLETALGLVKNTLENLEVNLQFWSRDSVQPYEYKATWVRGTCSTRHMSALTTLSIPLMVLSGWKPDSGWSLADTIPSNLQHLTIFGDCGYYDGYGWEEEDLLQEFDAFFGEGRWKTLCPNLQEFRFTHSDWDSATELEELCLRNGVIFTLESADLPPVI